MIKPAIRNFRKRTDYSEYGGAPLLGINGTCIISHGRSSSKAIKNAIRVSAEMAKKKVHENITHALERVCTQKRCKITSSTILPALIGEPDGPCN